MSSKTRRQATDDLLARIEAVVTGHEHQYSGEGAMFVSDAPLVFEGDRPRIAPVFASHLATLVDASAITREAALHTFNVSVWPGDSLVVYGVEYGIESVTLSVID